MTAGAEKAERGLTATTANTSPSFRHPHTVVSATKQKQIGYFSSLSFSPRGHCEQPLLTVSPSHARKTLPFTINLTAVDFNQLLALQLQ